MSLQSLRATLGVWMVYHHVHANMLSVTDMDAADDIDTAPAISYHELVVLLSPSSTTQSTPTFQ